MKLERIFCHPIKSVGSQVLRSVNLQAGAPLPGDRVFAIAHGRSGFDPAEPGWRFCEAFVRIANVPALAAVSISYDPETRVFRGDHPGRPGLDADLTNVEGRGALADWVGTFAASVVPGPYAVAEAPGETFTDSRLQTPSLMSLASLRDLGARMGVELDPRRFRGNFWIDGSAPWAEFDWIGRELVCGDVRLKVIKPIERCLATAANPVTGLRDNNPLPMLRALFDDPNFGVQVEIVRGGTLDVGAQLELVASQVSSSDV